MVKCDICHTETDVGVIVNGFICCDSECANVAKEPNNFEVILKGIRMGYPVL